ncbi:transcription factor Jun [Rhipicephalus sanguineus]|uniref:BZIP domain-containing protein n=1 Tax=Rhipicephalus sanguineus TaxID=34632 RepID=A0A9D4SM95_RHISA|nr:transcription factor Jun [Rhipicephalus sanguineus]KAH7935088.1 hypothetical protein HPB52_003692 [Rhipicephalus sanguineus]
MSDSSDSTTNNSFFHPWSSEHLPTGGCEEEKPQTVPRPDGTQPLSVGFGEMSSDGTSDQPTATYQPMQQEQLLSCEELVSRKRSMTLNLGSPGASQRSTKQARCSSLLTSPDLQMLMLSTPELERFIIALNAQDSTVSRLFLLTMTKEEEQYPSGFPDTFAQLQLKPPQPALQQHTTSGPDTSDSVDSTSNDSSSHPSSSEPQTVPRLGGTPPLSSVGFDEKSSDGTSQQPTATYQPTLKEQLLSCEELVSRKRSMALDLESPGACQRSSKQARCSSLLTSPDLRKLALSTPELERLIINLNGQDSTVSKLFLFTMSEDGEQCLSGFPKPQPPQLALNQHATSGPDSSHSVDSTSNDSFSRTSSSSPQTAPRLRSTPPQSPISMGDRERIRLEQRRERNRIAAHKCRQRKLDRDSELEAKVNALKAEKTVLEYDNSVLRHEVYQLSQEVRTHIKAGCKM